MAQSRLVTTAGILLWIWPSAGKLSVALTVVFKGGFLVWAADEIIRGVNPWRRCLGMAVAVYVIATLLQ
ncbi:hypothetical protein ACVWZM_004157 [Bradyrhizobium sp. USDA 4501]